MAELQQSLSNVHVVAPASRQHFELVLQTAAPQHAGTGHEPCSGVHAGAVSAAAVSAAAVSAVETSLGLNVSVGTRVSWEAAESGSVRASTSAESASPSSAFGPS